MIERLHSRQRSGLFRSLSGTAAVCFLLVASTFIAHHHDPAQTAGDNGPQCQLCLQVGTASPAPALYPAPHATPVITRAPRMRREVPFARLHVHAYFSQGPPVS